ncbi:MAG: flagellin [Phycisphaeraceae bacterium]|nr:flagellin [Phycisphaeraceae bacterium]
MSRINTNVSSLIAQRVLGQNNFSLNNSLQRLSTGVRINRGKDDPAGLIASENLRSEITATNAAISNAERADQVVNIAEGGLQEISSLLTELQGLLTATANSAGLSESEKDANQLQIDSILQTIDRISSSTNFQGVKLLNGNFDYGTSSISSDVSSFRVKGAKFDGDSLSVDVLVTQSAQKGQLFLDFNGAALDFNGTNSSFVFEVSGALGSRELQFGSGTSLSSIADAINTFTEVTGVVASANGEGITLKSSQYGSKQFVSVEVIEDGGVQGDGIFEFDSADANTLASSATATFASTVANNGITDSGQDIGANINGVVATTVGREIRVNSDILNIEITLDETAAQTLAAIDALEITGGGADFQLASSVDIAGKVSLGISEVAARKLGKTEDGDNAGSFFNLADLGAGKTLNLIDGDLTQAQKVVANAIGDVTTLRGRLGAFQKNVIGATIRSLGVAVENTSAAESIIRDADFAKETAGLTRSQILSAAAINTLSLANAQPQSVLQLLG